MKSILGLVALTACALAVEPSSAPVSPAAPAAAPAFHCQVPCGIYGDQMRVDMHMEDAATIVKAMVQIQELGSGHEHGNMNQLVRWTVTKEQHAQAIQDRVASYWLAQRIKAPTDDSTESQAKYHRQLALMHGITVAAMKCKQTTDAANVQRLREQMVEFSRTYFSEEDLKHVLEHHAK